MFTSAEFFVNNLHLVCFVHVPWYSDLLIAFNYLGVMAQIQLIRLLQLSETDFSRLVSRIVRLVNNSFKITILTLSSIMDICRLIEMYLSHTVTPGMHQPILVAPL